MDLVSTVVKPMHREGRPFVAGFAAATVVFFLLWEPLGWIGLILTIWCYYFFRDPKRAVPFDPSLILSPADGVVSLLERAVPPPELGMGAGTRLRVSVFMSVFNCHVNRAPIAGKVTEIAYRPGKFVSAQLDKASTDNERNALAIEMADGRTLAVVQIAGLVARRIVCFAKKGDQLRGGQRFGLIRFGSRLDVYLPDGVNPLVAIGQTMIAGETVIASLDPAQTARSAVME